MKVEAMVRTAALDPPVRPLGPNSQMERRHLQTTSSWYAGRSPRSDTAAIVHGGPLLKLTTSIPLDLPHSVTLLSRGV